MTIADTLRCLLGGRPMRWVTSCFLDVVSRRQIHLWQDSFGRYWMAETKWGWFRVYHEDAPEIWENRRERC